MAMGPAWRFALFALFAAFARESRGRLECGHSATGYSRCGLAPPGAMRHADTVLLQHMAGVDDVL